MSRALFVVIIFLLSACFALSLPTDDLVENLPNYNYDGKIYSGFLDINATKKLHYIFIEASSSPSTKPVFLYLGGGPGCTSMYNLFNDLGPLLPDEKFSNFATNEFAWTQYANLLFVDAPAGVGYSKTDTLFTDDDQAATDNLNAVISFFNKFPEYKKNDFHITGISYAGIYVPMLANSILTYNLKVESSQVIHLKGFIVGNPYTNPQIDSKSIYEFSYQQGLYSTRLYNEYRKKCDGVIFPLSGKSECSDVTDKIQEIFVRTNIYDIHAPCYTSTTSKSESSKLSNQFLKSIPCFNLVPFINYMNLQSVKENLHVNDPTIKFDVCNDKFQTTYKSQKKGSIYLYKKLINSGLRIFVLSGDVDAIVNYQGTQQWIYDLQLPKVADYRKWTVQTDDVSGTVYDYDGLTYVTFKGAGHMATLSKKAEGLKLLKVYLNIDKF